MSAVKSFVGASRKYRQRPTNGPNDLLVGAIGTLVVETTFSRLVATLLPVQRTFAELHGRNREYYERLPFRVWRRSVRRKTRPSLDTRQNTT